jgi:hypothetical protein
MDGFSNSGEAVESELERRFAAIERLAGISAITLLSAATWLAWPALSSAMNGGALFSGLGHSLIILIWGVIVQDLGIQDARARSRVGAASSIAWLPISVMAIPWLFSTLDQLVGGVVLLTVAICLFYWGRGILSGGLDVMRFRAVMGFLGIVLAASISSAEMEPGKVGYSQIALCGIALLLVFKDWYGEDGDRRERKGFDTRLNTLELRMLELKSTGAAVDQAASLVMTAREEGHRDPEYGNRLLDEAEEDIERSLSLADDVEAIRADALSSVENAEEIAPIVKRPRKAFDMAEREVDLGSLREGETLYRQAKKRAGEIIEWWEKAEKAITTASRLLGEEKNPPHDLPELLLDAKKKLAAEQPKTAFEFAIVIPDQLSASEAAGEVAEEALTEATRQLKGVDGINKNELEERLTKAKDALDSGDNASAKGLADGVVREINAEREAMDDVRRALRQKVHLISRWQEREDATDWDKRLGEIEEASDELQWTHAATLLERLTKDLDKVGKDSDEAGELLEFVQDEWRVLRNQCEASAIKVNDDERHSAEEAIALAIEAHGAGRIDEALEALGLADGFMEKLRRRI